MPKNGMEADPQNVFKLVSLSRTCHIFDVGLANAKATSGRMDLDTHADTCYTGENTMVLSFTGERVTVLGFSEKLKALTNIPIATVATVWECPKTHENFLLIVNEALYFGKKLKTSLLCPNQL